MSFGYESIDQYGFCSPQGYGFITLCSGVLDAICVTTIGNDGIWYGFESDSFGEISPGSTLDGENIYAFKWKADGEFRISFGVAGTTLITNLNYMIVRHSYIPDANIAIEDVTDYTYNDLDLATFLIGETDTCFGLIYVPTLVLDLDYTISRGTR